MYIFLYPYFELFPSEFCRVRSAVNLETVVACSFVPVAAAATAAPERTWAHVEQLRRGNAKVGALQQVHPVRVRDHPADKLQLVYSAAAAGKMGRQITEAQPCN